MQSQNDALTQILIVLDDLEKRIRYLERIEIPEIDNVLLETGEPLLLETGRYLLSE